MGVSENDAILLLRHFKWNLERLQEKFFSDDSAKLMKAIGLEFDPTVAKKFPFTCATLPTHNKGYCQICYSKFDQSAAKADSLKCGH